MSVYVWIAVNLVVVFLTGVYIWFFQRNDAVSVLIGQLFAQAAILLFFLNVNMYFIFLIIRKTRKRKLKLRLPSCPAR